MAATPDYATGRAADASLPIAVSSGVINLVNRPSKPPFAPQIVEVAGSAIAAVATIVDDEGQSHAFSVPINQVRIFRAPAASISTDANCTATAYWFEKGTVPTAQYTVVRNP